MDCGTKNIFYIFFFLSFFGFTQKNIIHYTTIDGLPHNITYGLFQDSKGYLWIGTDNGLSKFDGHDFRNFTADDGLRTNFIIDIEEDTEKDRIILATWGGGVQAIEYDIILSLKIKNDSTEKINNVCLFEGNILVRTKRKSFFYESENITYQKRTLLVNKNKVEKIDSTTDRGDGFFKPLSDKLLFFNGNKLVNKKDYNLKGVFEVNSKGYLESVYPFLEKKIINSICKYGENSFVATEKDSLFLCTSDKIKSYYQVNIGGYEIAKTAKIQDGHLLMLTINDKGFKEAFLLNMRSNTLVNLKKAVKTNSHISDVLEDNEGNIWISTYGDGVFCLLKDNRRTSYITQDELTETLVKDIQYLKGETFVLTPNNLITFKKGRIFKIEGLSGFGKNLSVVNNQLLVNSVNQKASKNENQFLEKEAFLTKVLDSLGSISYMDSIHIPKLNRKIYMNGKIINDAIFYKDSLWLASNTGTYFYDYNKNVFIPKSISGISLKSKQVRNFLKRKDSLWVSTAKGITLITNEGYKHYDESSGLINNDVNTILLDHRDNLWAGTQKGVSIFNGIDFINITEDTGLLSSYVEEIIEDDNNNIWIGGDQGITILDNARELTLQDAPILNITQNNAKFTYNAISYNRRSSLLCEYSMDEQNWVSTSSYKGVIDFENLSKGEHTVIFRAKKQDGVWVTSKPYEFKVQIPWYADWRYTIALFSFLVLAIIYISLKQLRKKEKRNMILQSTINKKVKLERELKNVRENIAQDFHDDLGNRLARISIFSNLLSEANAKIDDNDKELINQINTDADYLFKGTRDFIFSLKSESDYLEEVITYLSDFGEEYFRQFSIDFVVYKEVIKNVKLPYYWSKQLIFIFKEAMTNAAKHSKCDKIELVFKYRLDTLTIECKDNGIGFKKIEKTDRGLGNMLKRAERIGGVFLINTRESRGTSIRFMGKLH